MHFVGIQTDATRRKEAEAALVYEREILEKRVADSTKTLRASEEYLASIVQTIRESLLVLDKELTVLAANPYFYKTFKVTESETVGLKLYDLGNGQWNIAPLRKLLVDILPHNNPFQGFEVEVAFPHIGKKLMLLNACQIVLEGEYKDRILIAVEDATERREIEKRKDDFLSIASHELTTPLTSIKGYLQIIQKLLPADAGDKVIETLKKTATHTDRLNNLITDLLDVSKIQSGKLEFHYTSFDFHAMISEAAEALQTTTLTHAIKITGKATKPCYGDRERLEQVVQNLPANAIKYSPNSREVVLHINEVSNFLKTAITDYGLGIEKKYHKKIFERFYRVDTIQKQYPGMGIGLYVCEQIINQHGGTMWVESEIGYGATFNFTLPS